MSATEVDDPDEALRDWAASGAMALTGRRDGAPVAPPGNAATIVRRGLTQLLGRDLPGLLGERAAYAGFRRNAPFSCGGAFRIVPTADGHVGVSLPRAEDVEMVPALVEAAVADPWTSIAAWASRTTAVAAEERLRLLGMAGGRVPTSPLRDRAGVVTRELGGRTERLGHRPLVVDFTGLWAGPLCAHLLGLRGARVIKVETLQRPDGARRGPAGFFKLLHSDHESRVVDAKFDQRILAELVAQADLVLEASRPRALRQWGLVAEEVVASGTSWLSITARGRDSGSVGFGDDVAVSAGLFVRDGADCWPVGDALADPLSGVVAALHAADALGSETSRLIDVSMLHVAAETSSLASPAHEVRPHGEGWLVVADSWTADVAEPRRRP